MRIFLFDADTDATDTGPDAVRPRAVPGVRNAGTQKVLPMKQGPLTSKSKTFNNMSKTRTLGVNHESKQAIKGLFI